MSDKRIESTGLVVEAEDDQVLYDPDTESQVVSAEPDIITVGRYQEKKVKKDEAEREKRMRVVRR